MKKFFISVAVMLGVSMTTSTKGLSISAIDDTKMVNVVDGRNFDFKFTDEQLERLELNAGSNEASYFKSFHDGFCDAMLYAKTIEDDSAKELYIVNCIRYELRTMETILTEKQYHDFLVLFNVTLHDHEFDTKEIAEELQKLY